MKGELGIGLENGELDLGHGPDPMETGSLLEVGHIDSGPRWPAPR